MLSYIGQGILGAAVGVSFLTAVLRIDLKKLRFAITTHFFLMTIAFCLLLYAHLTSDFSLLNVFRFSHTEKPLLYKIAGVWGNHEGSMLLWVTILSGYGLALSLSVKKKSLSHQATVLTLIGLLSCAFTSFLLIACDPFETMAFAPSNGLDLNPLLQDPALAIHPPCLYLGFVGFSVPFILAITALIHGLSAFFVDLLYRWAVFSWTFLTLGLGLGSFWAYYELGWGGWWFWDPVENAALMPWLSGTALLHVLHVVRHREALLRWSLFLTLLTFSFCLFGTILVRSGVLTSVHSFAVDPERGALLLGISALICLSAAGLFFLKHADFSSENRTTLEDRSGQILMSSLVFLCGLWTVFMGTMFPLLAEAFGESFTVGTPYFSLTFIPIILPALCLMGLSPFFKWTPMIWQKIMPKIFPALTLTLLSVCFFYWFEQAQSFFNLCIIMTALWIVNATMIHFWQQRRNITRKLVSMSLSHFGVGLMMIGMSYSIVQETESLSALGHHDTMTVGPYTLTFQGVLPVEGKNYTAQKASFSIKKEGHFLGMVCPEKRFYWTQKILHGETGIYSHYLDHIYVTLGEEYVGGKWSVRAYHKPLINLLWFGGIFVVLGGLVTCFYRRAAQQNEQNSSLLAKLAAGLLLMWSVPCYAINAHELLENEMWEKRARSLCQRLLCPSCAGQSLDDSPSNQAEQLRDEIRQLIMRGRSDEAIIQLLVSRYGSKILVHPPFSLSTAFLWAGPWIAFFIVILGVLHRHRRFHRQK